MSLRGGPRPAPASLTVRVIVALAGTFTVAAGLWALLDPVSFYTTIGAFPPYNEHFLHDIGAFQLGLGLSLLVALFWSDALLAVLAAGAISATAHWGAHFVDRALGGHPTIDIPFFLVVAALLWLAAAIRLREVRRAAAAENR
ncbi:MAG: hypothetical protein QOE92_1561 [Chloroflexota bacterium]|jgi:hypothetical protein|nr:hypothetical protein [Chloroflexota bacterium]